LVALHSSIVAALDRPRVTAGAVDAMVLIPAGSFLMGSESTEAFPGDGEGPVRRVTLDAYYISRNAVTNAEFSAVPGACWRMPGGQGTSITTRERYPVVHVSWNDAAAYSQWSGYRLPTEAEWERAARGGLDQKEYPWGDELTPGGRHMSNVWQGSFPDVDLGEDGYAGLAPVDAFPPNAFGLFQMTGNCWEWCADYFHTTHHVMATRLNPTGPETGAARVLKGGSYLCHESYCRRYRCAARTRNEPSTSTGHIGFRVARDVETAGGIRQTQANAND
jgi:formylglycine-generating enzyme required for sulfatase activity